MTTPVSGSMSAGVSQGPGSPGAKGSARFVPGTMIAGRYRVAGLLGRGGMGEVLRADDLKLGQPVALKFLPEGLERDPERLRRFLNEARTARQVTHPAVCRVYDIGEFAGQHFLSMEYVDGEDLASLLRRIGRLPQERAIEVARQICAGLAAAHEEGILHRDLKPANIMIDGRGRVRITDFGLAGLAEEIGRRDITAGTPAYMAPEQINGEEVTRRSDIYSLGLVLYELFTGKPPFRADTREEMSELHRSATPSSPTAHVPGLDRAIERVVLRCLEKRPEDRPATVLGISAALPGGDPLAAALAAGETPSAELVAASGRSEAMRPGAALLLAMVALALFLGVVRWGGSMQILEYLPLEKRPEVLVDRSREILRELGYTEPVYAEPVGEAWGFFTWSDVFREVAEADSSETRWEGLRERPDAASFWYRQSPRLFLPEPQGGPSFQRGPVRLIDPDPINPGEVIIALDLSGRLRRFEVLPKRMSTRVEPEPSWGPLFALADLDTTRFKEDRPRYQRFMAPDVRRAWIGTRADQPELELRVEVGSFEGRPILFNVATDASLESLAEDPEPLRVTVGGAVLEILGPVIILLVVVAAGFLMQRNVHRGRADRRGAVRFGTLIFALFMIANVLRSPTLFTRLWGNEIWPLLVGGAFAGMAVWSWYLAAEPLGRQVWPRMFVTSSRLLSRPRVDWRDSLVGRSVLIGIAFGGLRYGISGPLRRVVNGWREGAPQYLLDYDLDLLIGQREALGWILERAMWGIVASFLMVVILVVVSRFVKWRVPGLILGLALWVFIDGSGSTQALPFVALSAGLALVVLLRWGIVAFTIATITASLAPIAKFSDPGWWHARGAMMTLVVVLLLAVYGVWAATGGRRAAPVVD